jgi:hypothetical protein
MELVDTESVCSLHRSELNMPFPTVAGSSLGQVHQNYPQCLLCCGCTRVTHQVMTVLDAAHLLYSHAYGEEADLGLGT